MNNITNVSFNGTRKTIAPYLYQWDIGQVLNFTDITLPSTFEAHIANTNMLGAAAMILGTDGQLTIPDEFLTQGEDVYIWIFVRNPENTGRTVYQVQVPLIRRPEPEDYEPSQTELSLIEEIIQSMNAAIDTVEDYTSRIDDIETDILALKSSVTSLSETSMVATRSYAAGDYVSVNGNLYKVTAAITTGQTLTEGTNVVSASLAEDLTKLMTEAEGAASSYSQAMTILNAT